MKNRMISSRWVHPDYCGKENPFPVPEKPLLFEDEPEVQILKWVHPDLNRDH